MVYHTDTVSPVRLVSLGCKAGKVPCISGLYNSTSSYLRILIANSDVCKPSSITIAS